MTELDLLNILNILTFFWLAFWAVRATRRLIAGEHQSILFVTILFFITAGFPLLFDVLVGKPTYAEQPGFYLATRDITTNIIYCLFVSIVPPLWWWLGREPINKRHNTQLADQNEDLSLLRRLRPVFFIIMISPLYALLLAPAPEAYLKYGAVLNLQEQANFALASEYHSNFIAPLARVSLIAGVALLLSNKRIQALPFILIQPWTFLSFWLVGKRSVVAMGTLLYLYLFWHKGYLRGAKLVAAAMAAVIVMGIYSYIYTDQIKRGHVDNVNLGSFQQVYETTRIEYGRDDRIKMCIYSELYPEQMQILEHRGQSLLFYATMYVPRSFYPEKPLPYAQYFTSAMFLSEPKFWGWSMTTTWLGEAISNFGWLGLLLGPLALVLICRIGDSKRNYLLQLLTILVAALLLAQHLVAFAPIFFLWLLIVVVARKPSGKLHRIRFSSQRRYLNSYWA